MEETSTEMDDGAVVHDGRARLLCVRFTWFSVFRFLLNAVDVDGKWTLTFVSTKIEL